MNYEQKYNASLEQAKKELATCGSMDCEAARLIFRLFPQLAESEDERVRTRLLEYFQGFLAGFEDCYKDGGCVKWEGMDVKSILNWLEKQKEQKHPNGCFTCDEYKKGYEAGRLNGFTAGYNKAMKEQKPAEWSEGDEKMHKNIIKDLKELRGLAVSDDITSEYENEISWLKSFRPSWKPSEEQMAALERTTRLANFGLEENRRKALVSLYEQLKAL